ncbi:MAG: UrcA family protein [Erythrobacter sp.]
MRFTLPLLALAVLAAPVAAETVTVRVGYGDVDVTTAAGRAALEARIEARLKKACTLDNAARYSHGRAAVDSQCLTEARAAAKAEVERVAVLDTSAGRAIAAN